jgi:hypothetical protein
VTGCAIMTKGPEAKRYNSLRVPLGDAVERIAVAHGVSTEAAWRDLLFPALRDGALSADGVLFPDGIQTAARPLVRCRPLSAAQADSAGVVDGGAV